MTGLEFHWQNDRDGFLAATLISQNSGTLICLKLSSSYKVLSATPDRSRCLQHFTESSSDSGQSIRLRPTPFLASNPALQPSSRILKHSINPFFRNGEASPSAYLCQLDENENLKRTVSDKDEIPERTVSRLHPDS